MAVKIRAMTQDDKPAIMNILCSTPEFKPSEVLVAEEVIDCYLNDPVGSGYHILVGEMESILAGYVCYGPTPLTEGTWDVYWIATEHQKQGQGIGSILMAVVEDRMREMAARLVLIETSSKPEYEKTRRFYYNLGYEKVSQIADFYAPGDDRLTLQKRFR